MPKLTFAEAAPLKTSAAQAQQAASTILFTGGPFSPSGA
jgi:hypothetical protein